MAVSEKTKATEASKSSGKDTGSTSVQITQLTKHIADLTAHLKTNKKDFAARRGLLQSVGQRRRLLRYLARTDSTQYLELIQKLGLRK